jgi:hypothetical protein
MQEALDQIAEQRKHPFPTPPVGETVQWFENNDQDNPRAAIVAKVEEPGRLCLTVFPPNGATRHIMGCWHVSHECHQTRGSQMTFRNGSWNYVPGRTVPKADYQAHLDWLDKKEFNVLEEKRRQVEAAEGRQKLKEAKDKQTVTA